MTPEEILAWAARHGVSQAAINELYQMMLPAEPITRGHGEAERNVLNQVRLSTGLTGGLLWRNNSGAFQDSSGRWVRYGLGNDSKRVNDRFKSPDLVGTTPVKIGGRVVGVFTAVETKAPGWSFKGQPRETAQQNFLNAIKARGGIATFATSPADYVRAVEEFSKNEQAG